MSIDRVIHLLWFDIGKGNEPYGKYLEGYRNWIAQNPTYQVKKWSRRAVERLILSDPNYEFLADAWLLLKLPIQQLDIARPIILHKYGGVYGDMDLICQRSIEPFVQEAERQDKILLMKSHYFGSATNSLYIGRKNHPFWLYFLQKAHSRIVNWKWVRTKSFFTIMWMTGPRLLCDLVKSFGPQHFIVEDARELFPLSSDPASEHALGQDHLVSGYLHSGSSISLTSSSYFGLARNVPIWLDLGRILGLLLLFLSFHGSFFSCSPAEHSQNSFSKSCKQTIR